MAGPMEYGSSYVRPVLLSCGHAAYMCEGLNS